MKKDMKFLKQNIIAHRGFHNEKIPENTISSFKNAIKNNYIIELDVHILKDKSVVVFHDDDLKRMTGINKKIKDFTYEELKDIKIKNSNENIPLFKDVLKLVNGKVPIIIELKYDVKGISLAKEVLKILESYKGKYVVKSFNPLLIYYIKLKKPEIIRGQLITNKKLNNLSKIIIKSKIIRKITKPDFISCDIKSINKEEIDKIKNNELLILGWTIKTKKDLEKAKNICDNYICENIGKLTDIFKE